MAILGTPTSVNNGGTYTAEAGTDRLLVLGVHVGAAGAPATITGVTFGGVAATEAIQRCEAGSEWGMEGIYYIKEASIPSGSQTVSVTVSAGTVDEISLITYGDVEQGAGTVVETGSDEDTSTTSCVANLTLGTAGDYGIILAHGASTAMFTSYNNGWAETLRHNIGTTRAHIVATKTLAGGGTDDDCTPTKGGAAGREVLIYAIFAQASGGASDTPLTVDKGVIRFSGKNVALTGTGLSSLTLTVEKGALQLQGQELPFELSVPGAAGRLRFTGKNVTLNAPTSFTMPVTPGLLRLEARGAVLLIATENGIGTVEPGRLRFFGKNIALLAPSVQVTVATGGAGRVFAIPYAFVVSATGRSKWVDYIPVKNVTPAVTDSGTFNFYGAISVELLDSVNGLTAWKDYIPVVEVSNSDESRWRFDNNGWIPVTFV